MAKLVDILARELKGWPECGDLITQDADGYALSVIPDDVYDLVFDGQEWSGQGGRFCERFELAEDHHSSIVTRSEWQTSRDALLADECEHSYGNNDGCPEYGKEFPAQWNGEGLPPVGIFAELGSPAKFTEGTNLKEFNVGTKIFVGGHANFGGADVAVVIVCGTYYCGTSIPSLLRPIRTPEQVAAEERKAGIEEIRKILSDAHGDQNSAVAIYDAGYRKQEPK